MNLNLHRTEKILIVQIKVQIARVSEGSKPLLHPSHSSNTISSSGNYLFILFDHLFDCLFLINLLLVYVYEGFPDSSYGKESACNAVDLGSVPGLGRSPGERNGNPLQYSCLENPLDKGSLGRLQSMESQRVRHG